jgi:hypothetical protein
VRIASIALVACAASAAPAPPRPARPALKVCRAIGVDWCNRSYRELHGAELVGGDWHQHEHSCASDEHITMAYWVIGVAAGDLDGDGVADAAVVIGESTYGCGDGTDTVAHLMAFGPNRLLARATTSGNPTEVMIANGRIELRRADGGTEHWQLSGGKLVR